MTTREIIVLLEQGLAYAVLALGIYITFRVLNTPDLTTEGSFTLGAAVGTVVTLSGHAVLGLLAAFLAGCAAGLVTGLLTTKGGVQPILSGILVMTGLYSVNLWVMGGKSNLSLLRADTVFTATQAWLGGSWHKVWALLLLCAVLTAFLNLFFKTSLGLSIRATGDNEKMVRASSISTDFTKCVALALANGLVGLAGAVVAQVQQFADVGMGMGMVVTALAALIIGEVLLRGGSVWRGTLAAVIGSVAYRAIVALALKSDFIPAYAVKLITALLVGAAVMYPALAARIKLAKQKGGARHAAH